jgi:hypothetical protein
MKNKTEMKGGRKTDYEIYAQYGMITFLVIVIVFSGVAVYGTPNGAVTGIGIVSAKGIIPTGTPEFYGEEIGISYDEVSPNDAQMADAAIRKLRAFENMELDETQMTRYIIIMKEISCEYCCGAKSIIFDDGRAACGCAHSFAMRGLGKYLVVNHPDISDEEILSEIGKWKVLFFPGIHEQKAKVMEEQGINSTDYINLASNLYRGIEKGQTAGGGMVGGC